MATRVPLYVVTTFLLLLAGASKANAFCRLTTEDPKAECECAEEGLPLFWNTPNLSYAFHVDGFEGVSDRDLRCVIRESFDSWVVAECDGVPTGVSFEARAKTTSSKVEHDPSGANLNVISLISPEEWQVIEPKKPTAYAVTGVWFATKTGEIFGADIHFNQSLGPFVMCAEQGCEPGTNDLRNVATHEIGHFLGLGHSPEVGSTMWCSALPGELEKRTLEEDDRQGLCSIYGDGTAWDPSRVDQGLRKGGRARRCSVSPSSGAPGVGAVDYVFLSIMLGFVYRRRVHTSGRRLR